MTSHLEQSPAGTPAPKAPSRRRGLVRFREQVNAIDELIHDHDPIGTGGSSGDQDDPYEGCAVEVMKVLRDAEIAGGGSASEVRGVIPRASVELVTRIVQAWD